MGRRIQITTADSEHNTTSTKMNGQISNIDSTWILCGRGIRLYSHEGNTRFRSVVSSYLTRYTTGTKTQKSELVDEVYEVLVNTVGMKFMRKEDGSWVEMSKENGKKKVSHRFRDEISAQGTNVESQNDTTRVDGSWSCSWVEMLKEHEEKKASHRFRDEISAQETSVESQHDTTQVDSLQSDHDTARVDGLQSEHDTTRIDGLQSEIVALIRSRNR